MTPVGTAATIYHIPLKDIDGQPTSLEAHRGKVLLIVNVASKCGFTPQYAGLEALYQKYKDQGFIVLGFPCNQFGRQEPGTNQEIKQFYSTKYHVSFPLFDKIEVNGRDRHALYEVLAGKDSPFSGRIWWNFTKFLVGRNGKILGRFGTRVKPDASKLVRAVESALTEERLLQY